MKVEPASGDHDLPTLDGLSAGGSTRHSPDQDLEVSNLWERAALLALFVETWYERFESPASGRVALPRSDAPGASRSKQGGLR